MALRKSDAGIQVQLTKNIHDALARYKLSGAQQERLETARRVKGDRRKDAHDQGECCDRSADDHMGIKVNEYGNAYLDENGEFVKLPIKAWLIACGRKWWPTQNRRILKPETTKN